VTQKKPYYLKGGKGDSRRKHTHLDSTRLTATASGEGEGGEPFCATVTSDGRERTSGVMQQPLLSRRATRAEEPG